MAGGDAEQPRGAVENLLAPVGGVVHALGAGDDPGIRLEVPVRRERHPMFFERVRKLHDGVHGAIPLSIA
jgi:hypothetical protein